MTQPSTRVPFSGRLLLLGCGSVGQCTLPLILRHLDMPASKITVVDFEDVHGKIPQPLQAGVTLKRQRLTQENYKTILPKLVGANDGSVDLSWNVDTLNMLSWWAENDGSVI